MVVEHYKNKAEKYHIEMPSLEEMIKFVERYNEDNSTSFFRDQPYNFNISMIKEAHCEYYVAINSKFLPTIMKNTIKLLQKLSHLINHEPYNIEDR